MIESPNRKEIAKFLSMGLCAGIIGPSLAIQWADAIILAEDKPDISIIEVSLSGPEGLNKTITRLNEIKGEARSDLPTQLMLAYCWKKVRTKEWTTDYFSGLMHSVKNVSDGSEDIDTPLMILDDNLSLAQNGYIGTVEDAMSDIIEFLKTFEKYEHCLPKDV